MTDTPRSNELSPVVFMGSGEPELTAPERGRNMWEKEHDHNEGLQAENRALSAKLEKARLDLDLMRSSGIAEVAAQNPQVMEYIEHWEPRAEAAEAERDALDAAWSDRVALLEKAISEAGAERDAVRAENALLREAVIEAMEMDCAAAAWTVLRDTLVSLDKGAG